MLTIISVFRKALRNRSDESCPYHPGVVKFNTCISFKYRTLLFLLVNERMFGYELKKKKTFISILSIIYYIIKDNRIILNN